MIILTTIFFSTGLVLGFFVSSIMFAGTKKTYNKGGLVKSKKCQDICYLTDDNTCCKYCIRACDCDSVCESSLNDSCEFSIDEYEVIE